MMKIDIDYRARRYLDVFGLKEGQVNASEVRPGVTCAFHRHQEQDDYWVVMKGELEVILTSTYPESKIVQYTLKDGIVYFLNGIQTSPLYIPRGYWHGYRNITNETAILLYYVTKKYNPVKPDEERATPSELNVFFQTGIK